MAEITRENPPEMQLGGDVVKRIQALEEKVVTQQSKILLLTAVVDMISDVSFDLEGDYVTPKDAAYIAGIAPSTVTRRMDSGYYQTVKIGAKRMILRSSLQRK